TSLRPNSVVLRVVGQLNEAEGLHERRHVEAEPAAIALPESVPPSDRVRRVATPGLDGSGLRVPLLVRGAEVHPVAMLLQHRVEVVDRALVVLQDRRADLAEDRRWIGGVVDVHEVVGRAWWGLEDPRIRLRAGALRQCRAPFVIGSSVVVRYPSASPRAR